jgi:hypothetical protein
MYSLDCGLLVCDMYPPLQYKMLQGNLKLNCCEIFQSFTFCAILTMVHMSPDIYNSLQMPLRLLLLVMLLTFSKVPAANVIVLCSEYPVLLNHRIVVLPVPLQVMMGDLMMSVITYNIYNILYLLQKILMT